MTDTLSHPLPLDDQLCFSLYGASIAMNRVYKPMLDRLGLTYPQYLVLHVLWEEDGRTIGVIADRLALESSTITPLVKRLEGAGMVVRERSPGDERHVHVRLTEQGQAMRAESVCLADAVFARTGMTVTDVQALTAKVQMLRQALSATPVE